MRKENMEKLQTLIDSMQRVADEADNKCFVYDNSIGEEYVSAAEVWAKRLREIFEAEEERFDPTVGITHRGQFHADDVFCAAMLKQLFPKMVFMRVSRVSDEDKNDSKAIVFDIGWGKYDHHQPDAEVRPNGIKYAAFGLLWREYGKYFIESEEGQQMFDEWFVQPIDAQDNGQKAPASDIPVFTLSNGISLFNPNWDEAVDEDYAFSRAMDAATVFFLGAIESIKSKLRAKEFVEESIENADGAIVILPRFAPWQEWLFKSKSSKAAEALYVVFPSARGDWTIQAVPAAAGSFDQRKGFPEEWRGATADELATLTGVSGFMFCHKAGFLCACATKEDALKVAKLAVEA